MSEHAQTGMTTYANTPFPIQLYHARRCLHVNVLLGQVGKHFCINSVPSLRFTANSASP